jgi:hypothetical protein
MRTTKYIFIGIILLMFSCVEEIELDIDTDETSIVIDGLIADELAEYEIRVNNSAVIGVGNDNILTPVSGAEVLVMDEDQNAVRFIEKDSNPGVYKAVMQGEMGKAYHVKVTLPGGTIISSEPEIIPEKTFIDSLYFDVNVERELNASGNSVTSEFVDVFLNTTVEEENRPYLRWRVSGEFEFQELYPMAFNPRRCFIKDNIDINSLLIFNSNDLNGNVLYDQKVARMVLNQRFAVIYCIHVSQYQTSEREYNYWENVNQLINIDGTLFDPPPATIRGNLINESNPAQQIQGYFSVVSQSTQRLFIDITKKGFFFQTDCTSLSFRRNPPECADCTIINNSSLERPPYWPF